MRTVVKVLLVVVLLAVLLAIASGVYFYKRPMSTLAQFSRRGLAGAGLVEQRAATSAGTVGFWRGGQGLAVLFLHGAGDQAGTWAGVAPSVVGRFTMIAIDAPGHWESDPRSGPLDIGTIYRGIEEVVQKELPHPVTIVGNSMGGWMALLLAHRHPDWVSRLVLVNSGGQSLTGPPLNLLPQTREEARAMMAMLRDPGSPAVPDFMIDDIIRMNRTGPIGRIYAGAANMGEFVLDQRLSEITTPTDLLWGQSDRFLDAAYVERLAAALPRSRLTWIHACGHVPQVECPEQFREALMKILDTEPPGPQVVRP